MALFHFSENPTIAVFEPHVPPTNPRRSPAVWAIDAEHAPLYWFPRECPRATAWANTEAQHQRLRERFDTLSRRVHATELIWLDRMRRCELFVYTFDASGFSPWPAAEGQWTCSRPVTPEFVEPVGDLLARHVSAGVELRLMEDLQPFWQRVVASGLPFSGVRLRNNAQGWAPS